MTPKANPEINQAMEKIWIIGAGQFGLRAAKWLARQGKGEGRPFVTLLVDLDRESLDRARALGCQVAAGEGVDYLYRHLDRNGGPDWIVPAVPVHLAWEWCRLHLGGKGLAPFVLPGELETLLPNPMRGPDGEIYVSHADFICPPNCNEPDDTCTKTGKPRKKDLFRLLADIDFPGITPFVIPSVQLGPGVGGYKPESLFDFLDRIARHKGAFFAATACRCHGVVSGGRMG